MTLAVGRMLTHYEILGPLGAGAMGEVYRARDTRLDREVALKVLPQELAGDGERLRRFEREAKALASLNHSNVAQVFGIDQSGDTCFMAMELVPGEDLASRLARGPLSVGEAIDVCRQIAEGVEAAHEAGVIHRDLKPANVRITPDGKVKVLDFGLAKPTETGAAVGSTTDSVLSTEEGRLLGTPTYMAPEQARGKPIDRRVDVWAFGCVLYECLSGLRAFDGATLGDVLAAVLEREPDWSRLPGATPAPVRDLLERSLRKDPHRRLRDVGDARIALEDLAAGGAEPVEGRKGPARPLATSLAAALLLATGFWIARALGGGATERVLVSSAPITSSKYFDRDPTWSPGGERIAFSRAASLGTDLWVRSLSTGEELVLRAGPGDEVCPRWSPDGRWIALLSTDLPGVPVVLVPPTAQGSESARVLVETNARVFDIVTQWGTMGSRPWRSDGEALLVARAVASGQTAIHRVSTNDGAVEQLTFPPVGQGDVYPSYSLDEQRIAFVRLHQGRATLMAMVADGDEPEVLLEAEGRIGLHSWRPDGESIVYIDSTGVWELDLATRALERLLRLSDQSSHHGELAMSRDGRIAYTYGGHDTILTSLKLGDRISTPLTNHIGTNFRPRISVRDEIAYMSDRTGDFEIWVRGPDGKERQITHSPGVDGTPDWSPDGERIAFSSDRDGTFRIYTTDRFGGDLRLLANEIFSTVGLGGVGLEFSWSPASADSDGEELIGCVISSTGGLDLWGVHPDGSGDRLLFEGVEDFDWYLDSRRVIATLATSRGDELVALHLETGARTTIWTGPHDEIDASPDGRHVLFASGKGHASMGLALLELVPPDDPDGLPTAAGEPVDLVRPDGPWHIHDGTWSPDAKTIVYIHDADWANVHELIEAR